MFEIKHPPILRSQVTKLKISKRAEPKQRKGKKFVFIKFDPYFLIVKKKKRKEDREMKTREKVKFPRIKSIFPFVFQEFP